MVGEVMAGRLSRGVPELHGQLEHEQRSNADNIIREAKADLFSAACFLAVACLHLAPHLEKTANQPHSALGDSQALHTLLRTQRDAGCLPNQHIGLDPRIATRPKWHSLPFEIVNDNE